MRASLEIADIFRAADPAYRATHAGHLSLQHLTVMSAIEQCRTAALGGHVEACEDCGHRRIAYNSCRNRHCPNCRDAAARMWLAEREADLLPVGYFHVVFTLPSEVADIALHNKAAVYIRTARFPQIKSLDRIDFNAQSSLNKALILERVRYESPELHRAWAIRPR